MSNLPPAGWYQDPEDPAGLRWWSGAEWTEHRSAAPQAPAPAAAAETPAPVAVPVAANAVDAPPVDTTQVVTPATAPTRTRRRWWIPVTAVVAIIAVLAIVGSLVLPGLLDRDDTMFTATQAREALLTSSEAGGTKFSPLQIAAVGVHNATLTTSTVSDYIKPWNDSGTVVPATCKGPISWAAWKSFDVPSYRGWATDRISTVSLAGSGDTSQQVVRRFVDVAAAKQFVALQREWYGRCTQVTYGSGATASNYSAHSLAVPSGVDGVVNQTSTTSTDEGKTTTSFVAEIYLRRGNLVLIIDGPGTSKASAASVSTAAENIAQAAAAKLDSLEGSH